MGGCAGCGTINVEAAKFCNGCGERLAALPEPRRRFVTALFCDLVGSTGLGQRLDAEPLRRLLDRYFGVMAAAIERHGGTVEKFIGDAVVGTFGIPVAHEDDAFRAVRAALEMVEASGELEAELTDPGLRTQVRIAINSGEVFADEGAAKRGSIGGDVYNTAARLQSAAHPGDVLVGGPAEPMLRGKVDLAPLGQVELRGKTEPVTAYRVIGVHAVPVRMETPFVGRDRRLASLREALQDAVEARACVLVTVLSPPGVGKSRLAAAFTDTLREEATVLIGQTPSYGEGVTFAPLVELLAQAAGSPSGEAEVVAARLGQKLSTHRDGPAVADRIAQILGVGEAHASDTSWAVRRLLEILAADRPLVVVLEDLHWAEQPMLDLVDSVVERLHGPVLVLCLARPELLERRPTWGAGKPWAMTATLPPLSSRAARRLAAVLLGKDAPVPVLDRVCETAEGNPLYLEQLTAMLADQGYLEGGRWVGPQDPDVEIPTTLQALITARLDRLNPATRQVLERASIEGRRFRMPALSALATGLPSVTIEEAVAELDRRGLVEPEDEAAGQWRFTHALVREAAYRGVSKELRSELHEALANWIAEKDADRPDVDEAVGRHLERALHLREEIGLRDGLSVGLAHRAGERFASAGERAFAALDFMTSRDLLGRAEGLLPERSPVRLNLLPNLGVALTETGRPGETESLLTKAIEQARTAGSEREALRALIQLQSNCVYRSPSEAEIETALLETRAAFDALQEMGDGVALAEAAVAAEYLEWMLGRVAQAHTWTLRALEHALVAKRPREAAQAAADFVWFVVVGPLPFDRFAEVAARLPGAQDNEIRAAAEEALRAVAALARGKESSFREHEERWRETIDRHGLSWLGATHQIAMGQVEISVGNPEQAEPRLREARATLAGFGDIWWCETVDAVLCMAIRAQDRRREFLRLADAFERSVLVPDRQMVIRLSIVQASALMLRGSAADAEAAARRGLELAERTDLVPDHADALLTLADTLQARGLPGDATLARSRAAELFRAKGNLAAAVNAEHARRL
jgi:class 3 adenylate cyclase/tetratricopeptide (TPR) repeat protein